MWGGVCVKKGGNIMGANLFAQLREQIRRYGDRRTLYKRRDGARYHIAVREYDGLVCAAGLALYRLSVGKVNTVSRRVQNRREWIKSDLPAHEVGYDICHSESKISIPTDKTILQKDLDVPVKISTLRTIVVLDVDKRLMQGHIVGRDPKRFLRIPNCTRPDYQVRWG